MGCFCDSVDDATESVIRHFSRREVDMRDGDADEEF